MNVERNDMKKNITTSVDVAKLAGVSQSAVSRAYSPKGSIATATRDKVFEAASRLNYVPNSIARSLITRRSDIIAILLGDMENPFYSYVLDKFSRRIQDAGKQVLVFNVPSNDDIDAAMIKVMQYQVDGIVITSAQISMRLASICLSRNVPVVMFNRYVPGLQTDSVCCDNHNGGLLAADTLYQNSGDQGKTQKFAIIYGHRDTTTNLDRMEGFLKRLNELGVQARDVLQVCGDYSYDGGFAAAMKLLNRKGRPNAIFCLNDIMALGALDAAQNNLGLKLPDDIRMIGFDDIPDAKRAPYQLSTIRQPVNQMINETMLILGLAERTEADGPPRRTFKGRLIQRNTTQIPV